MHRSGPNANFDRGLKVRAKPCRTPRLGIFFPALSMGGVERLMLTLAESCSARGYPVDLVVGSPQGDFERDIPPAVRVVDLHRPPPKTPERLAGLVRYLRETTPDVLLSATDGSNLVAVWARMLARRAVRVVISTHLIWSVHALLSSFQSPFHAWKYRLVMPMLIRLTYPRADGIIAVSREVAEDIARASTVPYERIHVIPNPVITPSFRVKAEEPLEHPWFQRKAPPVVLGVGRLSKEKNFALLIEAFALARQHRPLRLMILGRGEEQAALTALANRLGVADDVALAGFVPNPYPFMREAAALVCSSLYEGFGNVLVEAMAVGTPVISTRCPGGPREILAEGIYGPLVPLGDAPALAQAILTILDHPPPAAMLQRRAKDFSLETIVDRYLTVLFPASSSLAGCHG